MLAASEDMAATAEDAGGTYTQNVSVGEGPGAAAEEGAAVSTFVGEGAAVDGAEMAMDDDTSPAGGEIGDEAATEEGVAAIEVDGVAGIEVAGAPTSSVVLSSVLVWVGVPSSSSVGDGLGAGAGALSPPPDISATGPPGNWYTKPSTLSKI